MRKLIKNNVLTGTFVTVTILLLATYNLDVKSISALWYTEYWLLYTVVLSLNGVLFMIGDNQMINKIAGLLLIGVVLFPISGLNASEAFDWNLREWLHHSCAVGFFIVKSLNHRKYDWALIIIGAALLLAAGFNLYTVEMIGLYVLMYTGYLKKRNYFKKYRTQLREIEYEDKNNKQSKR